MTGSFIDVDVLDKYSNLKGYDRFVGIDLDKKGRVWFATQPKGIIVYNPADQSVELPFQMTLHCSLMPVILMPAFIATRKILSGRKLV